MTYTLINGVKQTAKMPGKYEIQFQNNDNYTETDVTNLLTIENQNKKYCFKNPLLFALFNENNSDINSKTIITNKLNTSSENIVIKCNFGSGAKTEDVSFGFVDKSPPNNGPNVIFLHSSWFDQTDNDEVKKYALVLLEQYYNAEESKKPTDDEKQIIRTRCATQVTTNGGNPTKDSTRSSQKKTRKKRKIPKK